MTDREQMLEITQTLNAQASQLRRDDCGWWALSGRHGNIQTWGDDKSFMLYVAKHSVRAWTEAKKKLYFCEVTQDGDQEGILKLSGDITQEEIQIIREVVGLKEQRHLSEEARLALIQRGARYRFPAPTAPKLDGQVG